MSFSKSVSAILLVAIFGSLFVILIPHLDFYLNPNSQTPGPITIAGTGLAISLVTLFALYVGKIDRWSNSALFFFYFLIYNFLLIIIKFSFAPASLYSENMQRPFVLGGLYPGNPNSPEYFFMIGLFVLFLYLIVLFVIYKIFHSTLKEKITAPQLATSSGHKAFFIIGVAAIVAFAFITGIVSILIIPLLIFLSFWIPVLAYVSFLLPSAFATVIAGGLLLVLTFASLSFRSATLYAKTIKNASLLTTVAWTAGGLLIVFHGLWVIYIMVLISIWPFRVVSPSGK